MARVWGSRSGPIIRRITWAPEVFKSYAALGILELAKSYTGLVVRDAGGGGPLGRATRDDSRAPKGTQWGANSGGQAGRTSGAISGVPGGRTTVEVWRRLTIEHFNHKCSSKRLNDGLFSQTEPMCKSSAPGQCKSVI